ncbi:unnamed protein product [Brassicogethes aeneus]|uniref:DUF7869 domain-containing protein n=1 Tax=Brassicogethes aeneus TaxID=1431903 RepID=A0A9P0FM94_BRAAE|nr:unnamed protein product [Brassicogethes aeneus]
MFIVGLKSTNRVIKEKLLLEDGLTIDKAVQIAQSIEMTQSQAQMLSKYETTICEIRKAPGKSWSSHSNKAAGKSSYMSGSKAQVAVGKNFKKKVSSDECKCENKDNLTESDINLCYEQEDNCNKNTGTNCCKDITKQSFLSQEVNGNTRVVPVPEATSNTVTSVQKNIIIEEYLILNANEIPTSQDSIQILQINAGNANIEGDVIMKDYLSEDEIYTNEELANENMKENHTSQVGASMDENYDPYNEPADKAGNKNMRKIARNTGERYSTKSGKIIKKRKLGPLIACRMKCRERLEEENRLSIFEDYWKLSSHDKRAGFVAGLIDVKSKSLEKKKQPNKTHKNREWTYLYKFNVKGGQVSVCKNCFLKTLDETPKFIEIVMNYKVKSISGATNADMRGKHEPGNKTEENKLEVVRQHIASFPAYVSHYTRKHTNRKYLGSGLNLTIMYDLYCQFTQSPVSKPIYIRELKKTGLKFKKPMLDTCTICDTLSTRIQNSGPAEKNYYEKELFSHQEIADYAYEAKKIDIEKSKENNDMIVCTFDLQQVLPTPKLSSGNMFYKRQLNTYNLTVHNCTDGSSFHFMWNETVAKRGANEISSCLYSFLNNLPPHVSHVILYSDTCGGQNKNSIVISMMTYLMRDHPSLKVLEHKFLIPGHTHMECDCDHALIERKAKSSEIKIQHPRDWYQLVRTAGKKNKFNVIIMEQKHFFDFAFLTSKKAPLQKKKNDDIGNKFDYRKLRWLKFEKKFGLVHYKTTLTQDDEFKSINFRKTGQIEFILTAAYKEILPISDKKK